jgi:hypothetical protein
VVDRLPTEDHAITFGRQKQKSEPPAWRRVCHQWRETVRWDSFGAHLLRTSALKYDNIKSTADSDDVTISGISSSHHLTARAGVARAGNLQVMEQRLRQASSESWIFVSSLKEIDHGPHRQ